MTRVLVLDDDVDFTDAVSPVLQEAGYSVEVVNDMEGAAERIVRNPPDLLILDVMFPEDSQAGFNLAREIRNYPSTRRLPVIILSAVNTRFPLGFGPADLDDEWMPAQDFLEKPLDLDVLIERVERLAPTLR